MLDVKQQAIVLSGNLGLSVEALGDPQVIRQRLDSSLGECFRTSLALVSFQGIENTIPSLVQELESRVKTSQELLLLLDNNRSADSELKSYCAAIDKELNRIAGQIQDFINLPSSQEAQTFTYGLFCSELIARLTALKPFILNAPGISNVDNAPKSGSIVEHSLQLLSEQVYSKSDSAFDELRSRVQSYFELMQTINDGLVNLVLIPGKSGEKSLLMVIAPVFAGNVLAQTLVIHPDSVDYGKISILRSRLRAANTAVHNHL